MKKGAKKEAPSAHVQAAIHHGTFPWALTVWGLGTGKREEGIFLDIPLSSATLPAHWMIN